ncbi:glycosyl hydrolase [Luteimonas sp. Y-2-2-4F]|nr:glycoside hydrolase family 30 beta sandwich domain-containing protein [Luteimonas sp. Y-2-2-4F]MCD9032806.1 glycosyl hydrolase [Luteimonas sp. Y-2-2-4F]
MAPVPVLLGLLAAACAPAWAGDREADRVDAWTTTADHRLALAHSRAAASADATAADVEIAVRPSERFQRMVGFGAAMTDASAWLLMQRMDDAQRTALLRELFGREGDGIGLDFARLTIGASDFSRRHYSLDEPPDGRPDPGLAHFTIDPNLGDVVPAMRQALAVNPGLRIMASPWSAPAWMKDNGRLAGGTLLPEYRDAFARYLLRYVDAYAEQGIPIFALTVQNEPDHEPDDYPGMRLNAPARARLIGDHLGPMIAARGGGLQLFDWDHNWDRPEEPLAVLSDAAAGRHVSAVAWHCYGGQVETQSRVREAFPDKDVYLTECSGGDWEPVRSGGLNLQVSHLIVGATRHWARGVLFWNLALDERGGPHAGGCTTCRGVVTIDSATGAVSRTDEYYALAHASRFVRRDAWRIASDGGHPDIDHVAFENADDGSRALIVGNAAGEPRTVRVDDGRARFRFMLPARSVTTFVWRP